MSWLEDHENELLMDLTMEENEICRIRDKLDNEKLDEFNRIFA